MIQVSNDNTISISISSVPYEYTVNGIDVSNGAGGSTFYEGDSHILEVDFNDDSALNITIKTTPHYGGAVMINDSSEPGTHGYSLSIDLYDIRDVSSGNTWMCKTFTVSTDSNIVDQVGMHWISSDTRFPVDTSSTYNLYGMIILSTAVMEDIAKSKSGNPLSTAYIDDTCLSIDSFGVGHMPLLTEFVIEPSNPKSSMVITTMYQNQVQLSGFSNVDLNPTANVTEDYFNNMATIAVRNTATAYVYISSDNDLSGFQAWAIDGGANYIAVSTFDIHQDEEDYPLAVLLATSYGGKLSNKTDLGIFIKYTGSDASFTPTNVYVISSADSSYSRSLSFSTDTSGIIRIDGNSSFIEDLNKYWSIYKCALSYELHIEGEFTYNTKQLSVTSDSTDVTSATIQGMDYSIPLNEQLVS